MDNNTENPQDLERARENDGTFKADDPSTPDVNEAWQEPEADQGAAADIRDLPGFTPVDQEDGPAGEGEESQDSTTEPGAEPDAGTTEAEDGPEDPEAEDGDEEPEAEEDEEAEASPVPDGMARVTVTESPASPVHLSVNGKHFELPLNKQVTVPTWVIPTLEQVAGVTFTKE